MAGFNKLRSYLELKAAGLPVLQGIIVTNASPAASEAVAAFAKGLGVRQLLLRHDRKPERPPYPRGGFLFPVDAFESTAAPFFAEERVLFLLEPLSPFDNGHNVNVLVQDERRVVLEAVGPGFDASDLNRGDITPHEVLILPGLGSATPLKHEIVSGSDYSHSVDLRLKKIAARVGVVEEVVGGARRYLEAQGHDILLTHLNTYVPIGPTHVREALGTASKLSESGVAKPPFILSMSWVDRGTRFVCWDITRPATKYDIGPPAMRLHGIPASPGIAQGRCRVVLAPSDPFPDGEILVVPATTPDYIPLIGRASAVVTDSGGMLSHAAVVARELGKPCVVGTRIATQRLKTGDNVRVDGTYGEVTTIGH